MRLHFAREAAARIGLAEPPTLTIPEDTAEAARAVQDFRREFPSVSAVAAFDDAVAVHLLSVLHGLDVAVPRELAVLGLEPPSEPPAAATVIVRESV